MEPKINYAPIPHGEYNSFGDWQKKGYRVNLGAKSRARIAGGPPLFHTCQVHKALKTGKVLSMFKDTDHLNLQF